MKFVILDNKEIPGYGGVRGPIVTPTAFDLHDVLKWITFEIDIREVMSDGSYRKLQFNDERIMKEIDEELNRKRLEAEAAKEVLDVINKSREAVIKYIPDQLKAVEKELKRDKQKQQTKVEPVKKEESKPTKNDDENHDVMVIDDLEKMD